MTSEKEVIEELEDLKTQIFRFRKLLTVLNPAAKMDMAEDEKIIDAAMPQMLELFEEWKKAQDPEKKQKRFF